MEEIAFQARLATSPAKLRRASDGLQETPAANSRGNSMRPQAQPKICTVRQLTPPGRPPSPLTSGSATPSKRSLIPAPLSRLVLAGSWEGCIDRSNPTAFQANSSVPWERGPHNCFCRLLRARFQKAAKSIPADRSDPVSRAGKFCSRNPLCGTLLGIRPRTAFRRMRAQRQHYPRGSCRIGDCS